MELNISGHQTSNYSVNIPIYEGPLDLLLRLIEHSELEITAISIAQVTDQFLAHIHRLQVPPDEISAFLVVAAKLIQIKSEALLPRPPTHESGDEDLGSTLARQLLIYKRFKELAGWLETRTDLHLSTYLRVAPPPHVESHLDLSNLTLTDLVASAEAAFSDNQAQVMLDTVISAPRITIRERIAWITRELSNRTDASFSGLISEKPSRLEVVVTFLALLELVKRYRVSAQQDALFGDIRIAKMDEWKDNEELEIEFE